MLLPEIGLGLLALSIERNGHEHLNTMQIVLVSIAENVLLWVDSLPSEVAGQSMQIEGLKVDGVDVQGLHCVLLLEVGDETSEYDEQDKSCEEDDESAVVGRLQIHLISHLQFYLLDHHLLLTRLLHSQIDQLLIVVIVSIEVLIVLIIFHHLQPNYDLPEGIVFSSLHAYIMC